MKILINCPTFYPNIGGIETIIQVLAEDFIESNHEVKIITKTLNPLTDNFPFEVIRKPGFLKIIQALIWSDLFFVAGMTIKGIWQLLIVPKPLFITHQTWYINPEKNQNGWKEKLKIFLCKFGVNISCSSALAKYLPGKTYIVPNSYQSDIFKLTNQKRDKDLVFLGRLVSDKGADLLIEAVNNLKKLNISPSLTIIGIGEDENKLLSLIENLKLTDHVKLIGIKKGKELVEILNQHRIMVVPSIWSEPFGIVALEGIACGCMIVGSQNGGLKEAIGLCGVTFPNGNVEALTSCLYNIINNDKCIAEYTSKAGEHLRKYERKYISKQYLEIFKKHLKV